MSFWGNYPLERKKRFWNIRCSSKCRGLSVPSFMQLKNLVPKSMRCPACKVKMNWAIKNGRKTLITIQHDRSGMVRLVCYSCNSRHRAFDNDDFYLYGKNDKRCSICRQVKKISAFEGNSKKGWQGKGSRCRPCRNLYAKLKIKGVPYRLAVHAVDNHIIGVAEQVSTAVWKSAKGLK